MEGRNAPTAILGNPKSPIEEENVIEWGKDLQEAHANFLKNRDKLFNSGRTMPAYAETPENLELLAGQTLDLPSCLSNIKSA